MAALHEREFLQEQSEMRPATLTCPPWRHRGEYQVRRIHPSHQSLVFI